MTERPRDSRRDLFLAAGAGLVAMSVPTLVVAQKVTNRAQAAMPRFAYTGCRTTKERNARGKGINVYRMDAASGAWSHVQLLEELVNPSFLAFDRTQRFLYAVHGDLGEVSAFSVDRDSGRLTFLNRQSTGGTNPVHLVADDGNKYLLVANYATGSLAVLPFRADGGLDPVKHLVKLEGEGGPLTKEQSSSHPHEISYDPSRRFLLVPDKGVDRIFVFTFDPQSGALSPASRPFLKTRPGAGPRHAAFHPTSPFVYVAYELDSSLATYRWNSDAGSLEPVQVVPSTPDDFLGANTSSEIDITNGGRFVYLSNRGHDSIGVFATDPSSGRLTPVQWFPSGGKGPRFVVVDPSGSFVYAANENSDTVVTFRIERGTGKLVPTGQVVETGSPTCIEFLTA